MENVTINVPVTFEKHLTKLNQNEQCFFCRNFKKMVIADLPTIPRGSIFVSFDLKYLVDWPKMGSISLCT
jgi:hypothetical protein